MADGVQFAALEMREELDALGVKQNLRIPAQEVNTDRLAPPHGLCSHQRRGRGRSICRLRKMPFRLWCTVLSRSRSEPLFRNFQFSDKLVSGDQQAAAERELLVVLGWLLQRLTAIHIGPTGRGAQYLGSCRASTGTGSLLALSRESIHPGHRCRPPR